MKKILFSLLLIIPIVCAAQTIINNSDGKWESTTKNGVTVKVLTVPSKSYRAKLALTPKAPVMYNIYTLLPTGRKIIWKMEPDLAEDEILALKDKGFETELVE